MKKQILVTTCDCGKPINVPINILGRLIRQERKNEPSVEFMRQISKKGVLARKRKDAQT